MVIGIIVFNKEDKKTPNWKNPFSVWWWHHGSIVKFFLFAFALTLIVFIIPFTDRGRAMYDCKQKASDTHNTGLLYACHDAYRIKDEAESIRQLKELTNNFQSSHRQTIEAP